MHSWKQALSGAPISLLCHPLALFWIVSSLVVAPALPRHSSPGSSSSRITSYQLCKCSGKNSPSQCSSKSSRIDSKAPSEGRAYTPEPVMGPANLTLLSLTGLGLRPTIPRSSRLQEEKEGNTQGKNRRWGHHHEKGSGNG